MDCQQCSDNLTAYMDGELLSSYKGEVSSHLETCADCAQELQELMAAAEFVAAHSHDLELTPNLWNNLRGRIAPMPAPRRGGVLSRLWARNRWLTAAAAVAATAVLAFGLFAYVDYVEKQEIHQYMSNYISERDREEPVTESQEFIELENPFSTTRPVSLQNPFR